MEYEQFIQSKLSKIEDSGFQVDGNLLNSKLFDFQKYIVEIALRKGRYAIFADCGLGKTAMQLSWSHEVVIHTGKSVLILCPLAVSGQTIKEGEKFNIKIIKYNNQTEPAPLQLGVIERCIALWSNQGDTVFTPFMGIGSEIYQAVKMNRRGIGIELKESYFDIAVKNIESVSREQSLF